MKFVDYSIEDVIAESNKGARIVFVGAGRALDTFLHRLRHLHWERYADFIADNNNILWGTKKNVDGVELEINSFDYILKHEKRPIVFLVVVYFAFESIYNQISKLQRYDNDKAVFFGFSMDKSLENALTGGVLNFTPPNDEYEIPKIIHYCWFGRNPIPDCCREWMMSWKRYCPEYEIVEWNEDNYDVRKCAYMSEVYDNKVWGYMADYARLDILHEYGGIYLDTDVELVKGIDDLLNQVAFCFYQDLWSVNLGSGFGTIPHNPIIRKMRDYYHHIHFDMNYKQSCVPHQMPLLEEEGLLPTGRYQKLKNINVYPAPAVINQYTWRKTEIPYDNRYAIHYGTAFYHTEENIRRRNICEEIYKRIDS